MGTHFRQGHWLLVRASSDFDDTWWQRPGVSKHEVGVYDDGVYVVQGFRHRTTIQFS